MHALLGLSSLLLVALAGYLALRVLRGVGGWAERRDLQLVVLAAPLVGLGVSLAGLHHFADRVCFLGAPPWGYSLGLGLPLAIGLAALGGLGLGLIRLTLLHRLATRSSLPAGPELRALADRLAERLGAPRARVLLRAHEQPLALTFGLLRPTLLLSSWMVKRLDRRELESVLAHELAHVARRDYPVIWLATVLRDAFFYLPTSRAAYRQLQREKELACDDLAVHATNRPLALASALAKVWQQAAAGPAFRLAQPLTGADAAMEGRIERLLAAPSVAVGKPGSPGPALRMGTAALVGLLVVQAANLAIVLAPMGCGPASQLGRLL